MHFFVRYCLEQSFTCFSFVSFLLNLRHKTNKSKDKTNTKIEFSGVNVKQFPKIAFFAGYCLKTICVLVSVVSLFR